MELFYLPEFDPHTKDIHLTAEESRHAKKVLRKRSGDTIFLTDGKGHRVSAVITTDSGKQIEARIREIKTLPFPATSCIEVGMPIIRPNRMDWAVEKLTELGVERITPLMCRYNAVNRLKQTHLERVAISAIKQSQQFFLPQIDPPVAFDDWVKKSSAKSGLKFVAHPGGPDRKYFQPKEPALEKIFVAVGPEGGFHPEEIEAAFSGGFHTIHLGNTVLRTETAAVAAVTRLKLLFPEPDEPVRSGNEE